MGKSDIELRISEILKEHPLGLNITEISKELNITRNTAGRYLDMLLATGHVEMQTAGPVKIYTLSERIPISSIMDYSLDLIFVVNEEIKLIQINDKVLDFFKVKKADILGKELEDTKLSGLINKKILLKINEAMVGKEFSDEVDWSGEGGTLHFKLRLIPITLDKGSHGVMIVFKDISEEKENKQILLESQQKLKELTDNISEAFFALDMDFNCIYWNKASVRRTGISEKDAVGKSLYELFPDVKGTNAEELYKQVLQTQQTATIEDQFELSNKENIFELTAFPSRNGIGILANDITEVKKAEDAMQRTMELFEITFNSQRDAIFILDASSPPIIKDCNPAGIEMFGYPREELLGRTTPFLHVDKKSLKEFKEILNSAIAEHGFLHLVECEMKRKDGTVFLTEHSVIPLKDGHDTRIGWLGVVRDISERKETQKALLKREERLLKFMDSATDCFLIFDSKLNVIEANKVALKPYNYKKKEIIGKNIIELVPDIKESGEYYKYLEVIKTGEPLFINTFIQNPKSGDRNISMKAFKVMEGLGVIITDIAEPVKLEGIMEDRKSGIRKFYISPEGLILGIDSQTLQILGYKEEELIGKPLEAIYAPESPLSLKQLLEKWKKAGELKNEKMIVLTKKGKKCTILLSASTRRKNDG